MLLEQFEVGRRLVVSASLLGEERLRQNTQVVTNAEHSPRQCAGVRPRKWREHRFQKGRRQGHRRASEEAPPHYRPAR